MESRADAELVVLSQRGDRDAFNQLARRWQSGLFHFTRRMLGNGEDARDICQEALLRAYVNLPRLRDPAKFKAWIHLIAINLCRDRHRSARSRIGTETYEEGGSEEIRIVEGAVRLAAPIAAPDLAAERSQLSEVLSEMLARISPEQRTAILLREYQGFTTDEIAEITGVPTATVRTRIFYGLKAVRRMLQEHGIDRASYAGRE